MTELKHLPFGSSLSASLACLPFTMVTTIQIS